MQIDAIVTDLDGTLLNEASVLSPFTLSTLAEARARGIRVIPASGRAARSMLPYATQLNTGLPYIACNGSQLVGADHTVFETLTLSPEIARDVIRFAKANGFYVQSYRDDDFYFDEACEISGRYQRSSQMNAVAVGDLLAFTTFPVPKLLCVAEPERVDAVFPLFCEAFPSISFTISSPIFLEAQPAGGSKGEALLRLAPRLGLTPEHTLAFGDSLNDVSMFSFAQHSVAMGNARDDVKAAARHICLPNTQDGVAHFIREHVLA